MDKYDCQCPECITTLLREPCPKIKVIKQNKQMEHEIKQLIAKSKNGDLLVSIPVDKLLLIINKEG